jgi:hypothetical protein
MTYFDSIKDYQSSPLLVYNDKESGFNLLSKLNIDVRQAYLDWRVKNFDHYLFNAAIDSHLLDLV